METDNPLKQGYLLFLSQGVFAHLKKPWQKKYCKLFRSSKFGIERLEVYDNEDVASSNLPPRIITLENCVKITPDSQKLQANAFVVVTKTSTYHFASVEENEMPEWLSALQSVAFKDETTAPSIEEDNDLYCSSGEGIFLVKLVRSDASARCGLEPGPYTLYLTSSAIQLKDSKDEQLIISWPYLYIRKYGYRDGKFTFEAGRKCETGEGEFQLEHTNQQEIYRSLQDKMKNMRKWLGGEGLSSPSIFSSDSPSMSSQFQVVLSREARSRSPLPPILDTSQSVDCIASLAPPLKPKSSSVNTLCQPLLPLKPKPLVSPTVETNPIVVINAPFHLQPKMSASHGSLDKISSRKSPNLFRATLVDIDISTEGPPLKPKPTKPPRKGLFSGGDKDNDSTGNSRFYRPVPSAMETMSTPPYDEVEVRQDAWRTLGMDDLPHTERIKHLQESSVDYEVVEKPAEETKLKEIQNDMASNSCKIPKPKFLAIKPAAMCGNYDTLQHFGSASKRNGKSGYKQVFISNSNPASPCTPEVSLLESYTSQDHTYHDYDEVEEVEAMEAARPADDSYLGYGMIRKAAHTPNTPHTTHTHHTLHNNLEYAVITKSKHV